MTRTGALTPGLVMLSLCVMTRTGALTPGLVILSLCVMTRTGALTPGLVILLLCVMTRTGALTPGLVILSLCVMTRTGALTPGFILFSPSMDLVGSFCFIFILDKVSSDILFNIYHTVIPSDAFLRMCYDMYIIGISCKISMYLSNYTCISSPLTPMT